MKHTRPPVCYEMEKKCVLAWEKSKGEDTHSLLVLADWIAEHERRPTFEALLRGVAAAANGAASKDIYWFYWNAPCGFNPHTETRSQGKMREAAMTWLSEYTLDVAIADGRRRMVWRLDPTTYQQRWICEIQHRLTGGSAWETFDGLSGIHLSPTGASTIGVPTYSGAGGLMNGPHSRECRIIHASLAGRSAEPPAWMAPNVPSEPIEEVAVFRRLSGNVIALFPELPSPLSTVPDYCVMMSVDFVSPVRKLVERAASYHGAIRASYLPGADDAGAIRTLIGVIKIARNWSALPVTKAPRGYRRTCLMRKCEINGQD